MFSSFFRRARSYLSQTPEDTGPGELPDEERTTSNRAAATSPEMVQTRRQSHAVEDEAVDKGTESRISGESKKKRKRGNETAKNPTNGTHVEESPETDSKTKRRRKTKAQNTQPKQLLRSTVEDEENEPRETSPIEVPEDISTLRQSPTRNAPAPKSSHKRFGSEEPANETSDIVIDVPRNEAGAEEEASSGDDEAPEAETLVSGQERAAARALGAVEAAEAQDRAVRRKRKDLDARLKAQASQSKKNKKRREATTADESVSNAVPRVRKADLPDLLPDEILAADPVAREPTPPVDSVAVKPAAPKRQLFVAEEKKPKDFKSGGVRVKLLDNTKDQTLPPKIVKGSRSLREQWLAGRRPGKKGSGLENGMPRRKAVGGFLRR